MGYSVRTPLEICKTGFFCGGYCCGFDDGASFGRGERDNPGVQDGM